MVTHTLHIKILRITKYIDVDKLGTCLVKRLGEGIACVGPLVVG